MPRRSVRRFVLEVLFLAGVAAAATVAELRPAGVIALMAVAWVVVALLEWTSWLDEPHYGRGLPPRYYVPQTALPPPRAVMQGYGYVTPRRQPQVSTPGPSPDDAPTFVESADEWGVTLADWPGLEDETVISMPEALGDREPTQVVPLPPVLGIEETVEHVVVFPDEDEPTEEPEPAVEPRVAEVAAAAIVVHEIEPEPEPEPEPDESLPVVEVVAAAAAAAVVVSEPEPARVTREPEPEPAPAVLVAPARVEGVTLHRLEPLGSLSRGGFRLRRTHDEASIELADGPPPNRRLSERVLEQARAWKRDDG